jgi:hypothetical protein
MIKHGLKTVSAESISTKLHDIRMNILREQVINKFKEHRVSFKERRLKLSVIMKIKAIVAFNHRIREFIKLRIRQILNKRIREIKRSTYTIQITDEKPEMTISLLHRISFNDEQVIEMFNGKEWVREYDKQLVSNYDILYKMYKLNFVPSVAIYALSNIGSKQPLCYIQKGTKWQKLKLIKHSKSLCRKDYHLLIRWIKRLSKNEEFNKMTKARNPIMPYWSKLSSRVIKNLKKMDDLHLVDSDIIHHLKGISWYTYEFCYTIIRTILFLNDKNEKFFMRVLGD